MMIEIGTLRNALERAVDHHTDLAEVARGMDMLYNLDTVEIAMMDFGT
jgi:hypothetical protein